MKTLIISDIHGSHLRLRDALNTPFDYTNVILVGDLMYHGPRNPILSDYNPAEVAKLLNEIKKPILAVRGNCDSEVDQMLLNFPMMQDYGIFKTIYHNVFVTHGHVLEPGKDAANTHADIFISGHTHLPGFQKVGNTLCLNPGSISLPKEENPPTYAIMDDQQIVIYTLEHKVFLAYTL